MDEMTLKARFMKFAHSIVRLTEKFPKETVYFVISKQIIRAGSGSAANYRSACRARSKPDFINKLGVVEEETDESLFWLEFTEGVDSKWKKDIAPIEKEGNELLSIIVSSIKTSKQRYRKNQSVIRNPQSPIPNPQSPIPNLKSKIIKCLAKNYTPPIWLLSHPKSAHGTPGITPRSGSA